MPYSQLSSDDSEREEDFKTIELDNRISARRIQRRFPRSCVPIYASIVTILLFISIFYSHVASQQGFYFNKKTVQKSLGRDETYMLLEHEYDQLWDDDLAGGDKVFVIPNEDGSEWSDEGSPAMIAMLHQLHCVAGIRKALQESQDGKDIGNYLTNDHWPHCFDYLRRTILCWADDTFERPQRLRNGSFTPFIDGTSGARTCRDPAPLSNLIKTADLYNDPSEDQHHSHGSHER